MDSEFEPGDKLYLAWLNHVPQNKPIVQEIVQPYLITKKRHEQEGIYYCLTNVLQGRKWDGTRRTRSLHGIISGPNIINAYKEQLLARFGRTPEEAKQKAIALIMNLDATVVSDY